MNPDTIARDLARTADGGVAELAAGKLALKQRVERLRFGETFAFETILSGGTETLVQRKAALAFGSRRGQITSNRCRHERCPDRPRR